VNELQTIEWLSSAIREAKRSSAFCMDGCLPVVDPAIEVKGLGPVQLPLNPKSAKELIAQCRVAPYGKGTRTLVNRKVRNTFELDPKKFRLSDDWSSAVAGAARLAAEQLDLPAEEVEAKLYKLLVYEKGGFFLPHRDSEKHDGMVASMIVALPTRFSGGTLIVRHGAAERRLSFQEAAAGMAPCYAAFYADCEHEVREITGGIRLCLAYNLLLKPSRSKRPSAAQPQAPADELAREIASWVAAQAAKPLVFALEHHYTKRGLSRDLLKGADRRLADVVTRGAEKVGCVVHLAQVSRHLCQFADDGSFGRYSRHDRYNSPRRTSTDEFDIGEIYEDELRGTEWTTLEGKKTPWGSIPLGLDAIVSSAPIDDWKPTSEEYEGYTGNAGNTLDRWYHRTAIVIWRGDQHYDVVSTAGVAQCLPLFYSMAGKLSKTPKKRREEAREECVRFARAIISHWPSRSVDWKREKSLLDEFPKEVLSLADRETVAALLSKAARGDRGLPLSSFVVAACREFGWTAFAEELKSLLTAPDNFRRRDEIPFRDVEWLSEYCLDETDDEGKTALAHELCALAVERFCAAPLSSDSGYRPREATVPERSLPHLLKALATMGREDDLSRVIRFVQSSPKSFRLDECQIPALSALISWSQKRFGSVLPHLAAWLSSVRQQLESATATPPSPPTDWKRHSDVPCTCRLCKQLTTFLDDRANNVERIPAAQDARQHLIDTIRRSQCDVSHILEKKGRPYSLVLTKTTDSFDRAVRRYEKDLTLLASLPPDS
jgi:hypothetical protein